MTANERMIQLRDAMVAAREAGDRERADVLHKQTLEATQLAIDDLCKWPVPVYDFEPLEVAS